MKCVFAFFINLYHTVGTSDNFGEIGEIDISEHGEPTTNQRLAVAKFEKKISFIVEIIYSFCYVFKKK